MSSTIFHLHCQQEQEHDDDENIWTYTSDPVFIFDLPPAATIPNDELSADEALDSILQDEEETSIPITEEEADYKIAPFGKIPFATECHIPGKIPFEMTAPHVHRFLPFPKPYMANRKGEDGWCHVWKY